MKEKQKNNLGKLQFKSLRARLVIVGGFGILLTVVSLVIYSSVIYRQKAIDNAIHQTQVYAETIAQNVENEIEPALNDARTLAQTFSAINALNTPLKLTREQANAMLIRVLIAHESYYNIFTIWEPNLFDGLDAEMVYSDGSDFSGRYIPRWIKRGEKYMVEAAKNYETDGEGDYYLIPKRTLSEAIIEPRIYEIIGAKKEMITAVCPIITDNKFQGVVGIDINVDWVKDFVVNQHNNPTLSSIMLITNAGKIIGHSRDKTLIGQSIHDVFEDNNRRLSSIVNGEIVADIHGDNLEIWYPVYFGQTSTPWQIVISVPYSSIKKETNLQLFLLLLIGIFIAFLGISAIYYFISFSVTSLKNLSATAQRIALGDLQKVQQTYSNDEIGMVNKAFNDVVESLSEVVSVGDAISKGDFTRKVIVKSHYDILGKSINSMIESLQKAEEEEEKRIEEDRKRNWVTNGLAKFGDLLRAGNSNTEELADSIMSNLTKYLNCSAGGLFIYNDEDVDNLHFELLASYAYNRRKFLEKTIIAGEGLVGTVAIEKVTILLTEIPNNYIEIISGLGGALPKSILVVPLKLEDKIFGVIELASLDVFQKHEIEFVEKIGENIASTLSNAKINARTAKLLEETKRQAEEKASQEEEMRQNMEELQATQEEAARKEIQMEGILSAIDHTTLRAEFSLDGTYLTANENYISQIGYSIQELKGSNIRLYIPADKSQEFEEIWESVIAGKQFETVEERQTKDGLTIWLLMSYTPIYDTNGDVDKILFLANNITTQKQVEIDAKKLAAELKANETEMHNKRLEVEAANNRLVKNEDILRKALEDAKKKEKELRENHDIMKQKEAELLKTVQELDAAKKEMDEKQNALEKANTNMERNAAVLQKAFDSAKSKEKEIKVQNEIMKAQEEELKQNLEVLSAAQADMRLKQKELEVTNDRMKENEIQLEKALLDSKEKERELHSKQQQLLEQEEELRMNLEELYATQEEMERKQAELESSNQASKENERRLKETLEIVKQSEFELRHQQEINEEQKILLQKQVEEMKLAEEHLKTEQQKLQTLNSRMEANAVILQKQILKDRENSQKLKVLQIEIQELKQTNTNLLNEASKKENDILKSTKEKINKLKK